MTLSLHVDRSLFPAGAEVVRFVAARITAPPTPPGWRRPPVSLGLAIDRSSSMRGAKLAHVQAAVVEALGRLAPTDRFTVVAFDATLETLALDQAASHANVAAAIAAVRALRPGAGTNLSDAWLATAAAVERSLVQGEPTCPDGGGSVAGQGVAGIVGRPWPVFGRCLLLTDGQASCGAADPHLLMRHAATLRARGVSTSTVGVGRSFDELLLRGVSDAGGGSFRYVDGDDAIAPAMRDELGEALDVVARGVTIRVEAPADVQVGVLGPYPVARTEGAITIGVPDLVSGQVLELVIHVVVPRRAPGERVTLTGRSRALGVDGVAPHLRAAEPAALRAQRGDRDVVGLVAHRVAAAARERAALMNQAGTFQRAADELTEAARRLRSYVGGDATLQRVVADLEADAGVVRQRMAEPERRSMFAAASSMIRSRRPDGGSWRP